MAIEGINVAPAPAGGSRKVATDTIDGQDYQIVKLAFGADGTVTLVGSDGALPVIQDTIPLATNAATEATAQQQLSAQNDLLTAFTEEVPELPKTPLMADTDLTPVTFTQAGAGNVSVVAAAASLSNIVRYIEFTIDAAGTVELTDGAAGAAFPGCTWVAPAQGGYDSPDCLFSRGICKGTANTATHLKVTGSATVKGSLFYDRQA